MAIEARLNYNNDNIDAMDVETYDKYITYQRYIDGKNKIFYAEINPDTGQITSAPIEIADNAQLLSKTYNGPEFCIDGDDWFIFYTALINGNSRVYYYDPNDHASGAQPLHAFTNHRQTILCSDNKLFRGKRLIYTDTDDLDLSSDWLWCITTLPGAEYTIYTRPAENLDSPRWIKDSYDIVYVQPDGNDANELFLYQTNLRLGNENYTPTKLTNDGGTNTKSFAYGWIHPETNKRYFLALMNGETEIGIYEDTGSYPLSLTHKIEMIDAISGTYPYYGSPEPFVSKGKSYISTACKSSSGQGGGGNALIYVISAEADANNQPKEIYLASDTGLKKRTDPEVLINNEKINVYYNVLNGSTYEGWFSNPILKPLYKHENSFNYTRRDQTVRSVPYNVIYDESLISASYKFPAIILSHGANGHKEAYEDIGKFLAYRLGIAVISLDHKDAHQFGVSGSPWYDEWQDRAEETEALADRFSTIETDIGGNFAFKKDGSDEYFYGAIGHSYGAYTMAALHGSRQFNPSEVPFPLNTDDRCHCLAYLSGPGHDSGTYLLDIDHVGGTGTWNGFIKERIFTLTGDKDATRLGGSWEFRKDIHNDAADTISGSDKRILLALDEGAHNLAGLIRVNPSGTNYPYVPYLRPIILNNIYWFFKIFLIQDATSQEVTDFLNGDHMPDLTHVLEYSTK